MSPRLVKLNTFIMERLSFSNVLSILGVPDPHQVFQIALISTAAQTKEMKPSSSSSLRQGDEATILIISKTERWSHPPQYL